MRPVVYSLFCLALFFTLPTFSQSTGSAGTGDSTRKQNQPVTVTYQKWLDSANGKRMLQHLQKNSKNLDDFLAEQKEQKRKEQRRNYVRIGAGVLFLFALFFAFARRSRLKNQE